MFVLLALGVVFNVRRPKRFSARDPLIVEVFPPFYVVLVLRTNPAAELRDYFLSVIKLGLTV